jgi:hypothetical protein
MVRKLVCCVVLFAFALTASLPVGAQSSSPSPSSQAFLRLLQLANDGTVVSLSLDDGRTVLTNLTSGSVSDYIPYAVNRSTFITLTVLPTNRNSFRTEWSVPPLTPGYHTAALVGSSADNTLQLTFIAEDELCEGELAFGSCVILINNVKGSPAVSLQANHVSTTDQAAYRQTVVGGATAGSFLDFRVVDAATSQTTLFQLQRGFFEPNVIYIYSLRGNYPGRPFTDYSIGTLRRVPVDTMTFLRGLTADLNLSDGTTLFSTENIVAVMEQSGFDQLVQNSQLPLTVFAPVDSAILEIAGLYECALSDPAALRALILNHIVVGSYTSAQLISAGRLPTVSGTTHTFTSNPGGFLIDNTVRVADSTRYPTVNGNVYLTDTVLVPPGFEDQYCTQG